MNWGIGLGATAADVFAGATNMSRAVNTTQMALNPYRTSRLGSSALRAMALIVWTILTRMFRHFDLECTSRQSHIVLMTTN